MIIDSRIANFLHTYFDKIFVVSIERARDRQEKIKRILEPLQYEFFMGVDKKNLNLAKLEQQGLYSKSKARRFNRRNKAMILGAIACSLSHRALYQHILNNQFARVLVFEDDLLPLHENLHQLTEAINELPEDWELLYLGYIRREEITSSLKLKHFFYKMLSNFGFVTRNRKIVNDVLPVMYSRHLRIAGYHDCTHAYALTREAARKLIEIQTPVAFNSDNVLSYSIMNGQLKAFITEPGFFDQEQFSNPAHRSFVHH